MDNLAAEITQNETDRETEKDNFKISAAVEKLDETIETTLDVIATIPENECAYNDIEVRYIKRIQDIIRRQNCALDVHGFQSQNFEHVLKSMCILPTNFAWIRHTYTCNASFVGAFVL